MKIPFLRPYLPGPQAWVPILEESYRQAWFTNYGPLYRRFCEEVRANYASPGAGVALLSNATAAMTAVLVSKGISGKVVCPAFTFPATLQAIIAAGCTPVLCDADPETWELDLTELKSILEQDEIAAVAPVRTFGFVRDLGPLVALCRERGCDVVVDAAASFGHPDTKKKVGSPDGIVEVFSLHATKVFAIGEGGLVVGPEDMIKKLEATSNFGLQPDRTFGDGFNCKVDEARCAIALAMLGDIDGIIRGRRDIAERVLEIFRARPDLATLPVDTGPTPWQTLPIRFRSSELRNRAQALFLEKGIETRPYYTPSMSQGYRGAHVDLARTWRPTPVADRLSQEMLCLPVYQSLSADERDYLFAATAAVAAALPSAS